MTKVTSSGTLPVPSVEAQTPTPSMMMDTPIALAVAKQQRRILMRLQTEKFNLDRNPFFRAIGSNYRAAK